MLRSTQTSLYPWVNKYCRYLVGRPKITADKIGDLNDHFGIIKCKILPPRGLYLPILPLRCNGKFMLPLCRTCAEELNQNPCQHGNHERSFIGTWVTEEVKLSIQKGYQLMKVIFLEFYPLHPSNFFNYCFS
ncbi:hypothetical protein AVEN_7622-1 [Araneus ventricosus]|uniref:DNA-directed DNA polymerase n=1 Tax=Araneus ventricosus TaxID=182803 RepID=A0A4Y2N372_ARAVE|nr:hypothetical protein AVEN_7622-1 [Araneus ventricosus]